MELQGKYGTAKVYTDVIEQTAISQIIELLNQPFADGANVRIMPDVHAGKGCTIGTTMKKINGKVCPQPRGRGYSAAGFLLCALLIQWNS